MRIATPFELDVARGDRHLAGRDRVDRLAHRPPRSRRRRAAPSKATIAASPAGIESAATTCDGPVGVRGRVLGGEEDVRVVREHDRLVARRATATAREQVGGRRVHRLAALDDADRAVRGEALEQPPVAVARDDGDDARRRALRGAGRARRASSRSSRCVRLLVHVRDLDAVDRPARDAERERAPGIVGVDVHLERARVADDEQRVAELLELVLERVAVEPFALDQEDGAVAVARELLVDRLDAERAPRPAAPRAPARR